MKTKKSKRFLNLATLCLALLGTTLLMGRPVKAEGSVVSDNSSGSTSSLVDDSERDKIGRQYEAGDLTLPYNKGRYDGYIDGYEDGKKQGALHPDPTGDHLNKLPKTIPYKFNDRSQKMNYEGGYSDSYPAGYYNGWADNNKIQATLEWLRGEISNWFSSIFTTE
ncbi:TPA: hypothetical protein ACF44E_001485 [Streptococcus pyogenes]